MATGLEKSGNFMKKSGILWKSLEFYEKSEGHGKVREFYEKSGILWKIWMSWKSQGILWKLNLKKEKKFFNHKMRNWSFLRKTSEKYLCYWFTETQVTDDWYIYTTGLPQNPKVLELSLNFVKCPWILWNVLEFF